MARVHDKLSKAIVKPRKRLTDKNLLERAMEWRNFYDEMPPGLAIIVSRLDVEDERCITTRGELWATYRLNWGTPRGQWRLATPKERTDYIEEQTQEQIRNEVERQGRK